MPSCRRSRSEVWPGVVYIVFHFGHSRMELNSESASRDGGVCCAPIPRAGGATCQESPPGRYRRSFGKRSEWWPLQIASPAFLQDVPPAQAADFGGDATERGLGVVARERLIHPRADSFYLLVDARSRAAALFAASSAACTSSSWPPMSRNTTIAFSTSWRF